MRSPFGALVDAVRRPATPDAQPPVPYVPRAYEHGARYYGAYGSGSAEQQMRTMGSVSTLWSVVHHLSVDTSRACWRLYRTAKSGKPEDRVEVTSHAALDLWRRPNKFMPTQEFTEVGQQHLDLTGENWWVIARHDGARNVGPLELWPVRPDRMLPVPSVEHFLAGYLYLGPDGEQVPLGLDDVIMLRMPNPLDPYRGMGPVQALMSDLDSTRASSEWNRNFFLNSAEPGGIIQVATQLSDAQYNTMRERWAEQHRGVANAHRVALIEGAQWVDRKITQRDMQFAELRDVSREIIREAYGIPEFVLGLMENANRASALASEDMYARHLIEPRLERIKAALNSELLPMFGATSRGLEFDYDPVSPDDQELDAEALTAKADAAAALVTAGYDPADVLTTVDLPEMAYVGAPAAASAPVHLPAQAEPQVPVPPEPGHEEPADAWRQIVGQLDALPAGIAAELARIRGAADDQQEPPPPEQLPDISPMQAAYTAALAGLLTSVAAPIAAWITALIEALRSALRAGGALTSVAVPDSAIDGVARLIHDAMTRAAHDAADQVVHEADQQGVQIDAGAVDDDQLSRLAGDAARAVADNMGARARRSASRRRPAGPLDDDTIDRVADGVQGELERDAESMQRADLGPAVHQGQHEGRIATLRDSEALAPSPAYYGSEQLDGLTCAMCKQIDGRWLGNSLADALKEYPTGGYIACMGGERCRGTIVATYRPATNDNPDAPGGYEKQPVNPGGEPQ